MKLAVYSTVNKNFEAFVNENNLDASDIIRIVDQPNVGSAYNSIKEIDDDYILFIHDDVRFKTPLKEAEEKIKTILKDNPNSIIGLAGSKTYDPNASVQWWADFTTNVGRVNHCDRTHEWTSSFGPIDASGTKTRVVDGVFMAMSTEFYFKGKPFASSNANDFYDIRACMVAESCYVIDYLVLHKSVGDGCFKSTYKEEAAKFLNDYNTGSL